MYINIYIHENPSIYMKTPNILNLKLRPYIHENPDHPKSKPPDTALAKDLH